MGAKAVAVLAIIVALTLLTADRLIRAAEPVPPPTCMDADTRELVRGIAIDGFTLALKEHARHLFEIWLRDGQDDPQRAINGMNLGISAFARSRQSMLRWSPPSCKGDRQ